MSKSTRKSKAGSKAKPKRPAAGRKKAAPKAGAPSGSKWLLVGKWSLVTAIWGFIAGLGVIGWAAYDLPDIDLALKSQRPPSVTILSASGAEIATRGGRFGQAIDSRDLPPGLVQAVLATEDRRFFEHFGVDPIGIARAMVTNVAHGGIRQGGSTITQQVAKNIFLTSERSYKRKLQEVLIALWLENKYSKDQILTLYLNRVYFGAGAYGVTAAAERYFGRPVTGLGLYEAAMIAGMLKAPSRFNPRANPDKAAARTAVVLNNMVAAGFATPDDVAVAKSRRLPVLAGRRGASELGYFIDWIVDRAIGFAPGGGDMIVTTTLDLQLQHLAETHLRKPLKAVGKARHVGQAALIALGPDGAVRAMVGGKSYRASPFNRATQARRQPGSAFKAFVYLAGMEAGLSPNDLLTDGPVSIEGWQPKNYGNKPYLGAVTLRDAFAKSLNTVAVQVSEQAGRAAVAQVAARLGIQGNISTHPSIALGVSEVTLIDMATAFAPFANGGTGVWAYGIDEIVSPDGLLIYRRQGSGPGRVVAERHLAEMNSLFTEAMTTGTGRTAAIDRPAGGKTGTSQSHRDAVFVGFTPDLITAVWTGNDDGRPMKGVTGGGLPAQIWKGFMRDAHAGLPVKALPGLSGPFSSPSGDPAMVQRENPGSGPKNSVFDNFFDLMRDDRS